MVQAPDSQEALMIDQVRVIDSCLNVSLALGAHRRRAQYGTSPGGEPGGGSGHAGNKEWGCGGGGGYTAITRNTAYGPEVGLEQPPT